MLNQKDKLERFADVINKTAAEQVRIIEKQTQIIEKRQIEALEKQTAAQYEASLKYEMLKIRNRVSREISVMKTKCLLEELSHRQEIEDEIFSRAEKSLVLFADSEEYTGFLKVSLAAVIDYFGGADFVLHVREKDVPAVRLLLAEVGLDKEIRIDSENKLGGLKAESRDGSVFLDDSLLSRLEAQRQWFEENSGLNIS